MAARKTGRRWLAEKETKTMSSMNERPQTKPANGQRKPEPERPRQARARAIQDIFRSRWKELCALFPKDGPTLVTRAQATACQVSMGFKDEVTPESIAEACLACLHLGLEVGSHAYVFPFGNRAQLVVGPQGLITLAFRGGFVRSVVARAVFEGDEFDYNLGDNTLTHRKLLGGEAGYRRPAWTDDRGETRPIDPEKLITHVYAVIETTTEGRTLEVLTWEDVAFYRSFSKAKSGDSPWFSNFEGMARKTALKRALAFVPQSPILAAALREDERGGYEVPEEILVAARSKAGLDVPASDASQEMPPAGQPAHREPESEG